MKNLSFEVRCPRCGNIIKGMRSPDERQKSFECAKCTGKWSITFDPPDQQELEQAFIDR